MRIRLVEAILDKPTDQLRIAAHKRTRSVEQRHRQTRRQDGLIDAQQGQFHLFITRHTIPIQADQFVRAIEHQRGVIHPFLEEEHEDERVSTFKPRQPIDTRLMFHKIHRRRNAARRRIRLGTHLNQGLMEVHPIVQQTTRTHDL